MGRSDRRSIAERRRYHSFTLRTTDRREAEQFARREHAALTAEAERRARGLPGAVPMSEFLNRFEREELPTLAPGTQRSYRDVLRVLWIYFVDEIGDPRIDRVQAADIKAFLNWRRTHRVGGGDPVSNRTVAKDRAVLHRIFTIADQLELREGNPVARTDAPKSDGRDPVILSDDEYEKLLGACDGRPMLELYTLVLGETGARCNSEVLWLQWDDVDLEEGFLKITTGRDGHRTKSGKARWVPMTRRLISAMREHFAQFRFARYRGQPTPWVFHRTFTLGYNKAGDRFTRFYDSFKAAANRAGLPSGFTQHDLRHRRVTVWLAEGASPVLVKEALGHADLRTTMNYTHLAREHLRDLVAEPPKNRKGATA